jgi:hypothetical protein
MAYYLSSERKEDLIGSYRRYQQYLHEREREFPPNAFSLATSEWYQDATDHRCPHDGWLENLIISETPDSNRKRVTSIRTRLWAAYHDGYIEFFYPNVFNYLIESPFCDSGVGDWLYDEFRLSDSGHVIHEIEWSARPNSKGSRWIIESSDVQFMWIPQSISALH